MLKHKNKIALYGLLFALIISLIYTYKYQKLSNWNEQMYLHKTNIVFAESIKQYNGENLQKALNELLELDETSVGETILLINTAREEWVKWIQDLNYIIYTADSIVPEEDIAYGLNDAFIVSSEDQYNLLQDLFSLALLEYYFNSMEANIKTNTLNKEDLNIIQDIKYHLESINEIMNNNWVERVESIDLDTNLEYIQKIKKPFINTLEPDIKKLKELLDDIPTEKFK